MNEHNETHAEAIAALRRWGKCHFARSAKVREFCDRIEAAHRREMSKIASKNGADFGQLGDAAARKRIATPAEGMPPKRDAHRGAHPETAESCLGTGEMEYCQTVQIGEVSGGGRAEAKPRTATAGADPEPAKSFVNAAAMREACANIAEYAKTAAYHTEDAHLLGYLDQIERWAKAALSAPPRNCDVGTAEEQSRRFCAFCRPRTEPCDGCACLEGARKGRCEFVWAQMPYEADESEVEK